MNNYAQELDRRMWKTKGARYNAYRRYQRKYRLSITSISILSLYVFGLTLADFCKIINAHGNQKDVIFVISMFLSIGILILSLLEASKNYQIKSERLHNCSKEVAEVYSKLRYFINTEVDNLNNDNELVEITNQYEQILMKYDENHDPIDYELFQVEHSQEFNIGYFRGKLIFIKSLIISYWLYFMLIILPPIILYFVVIK